MRETVLKSGLTMVMVTIGALLVATSEAHALGACVYRTAERSATSVVCIDNVANIKVCEQNPGVDHRFYDGKTCAQLMKANQSTTDISLKMSVGDVIRVTSTSEIVRVPLSFVGVDQFTDASLPGTTISYRGAGVADVSRSADRLIFNVSISNPKIGFTGYQAGNVVPDLLEKFDLAFRSVPRVTDAIMTGTLQFDPRSGQAVLRLDQARTITAGPAVGFVQSKAVAGVRLQDTAIRLQGQGVTVHPALVSGAF